MPVRETTVHALIGLSIPDGGLGADTEPSTGPLATLRHLDEVWVAVIGTWQRSPTQ